MYAIILEKKALENLNKLETKTKIRIWRKLQQCKKNPFRFLEHIEEIEGFKLRVGDYRIIFDIDNSAKIIKVLKVGHRKDVYKK